MRPTIEHIRNSNLIEGIDSAKEDRQSWRAWEFLIEQDEIRESVLLELHGIITHYNLAQRNSGVYRSVQVYVGNHTPPPASVARLQIYEWLEDLRDNWETLDPKEMHVRFETIHPFIDGNGRTGRMLMWWLEVKRNMPVSFIPVEKRADYYAWFNREES